MMKTSTSEFYAGLARTVLLLAGLVILLWFLYNIIEVILVFIIAVVLAIVLNAPVVWLQAKGLPRAAGTVLVLVLVLAVAAGLAWLILPELAGQVANLVQNLPEYAQQLADRLSALLGNFPALRDQLSLDFEALMEELPAIPTLLTRFGRYSLNLLGLLALVIIIASMVLYMLLNPRPLLTAYVNVWPAHLRERAVRAFTRASQMIVAWMRANVIVGTLEAVAVGIFLSLMGIPGALLWAALAFFAELVPRAGPYLMAIPPILVALSLDPLTALWVLLFYVALNEVMSDLVTPRVRAAAMDLHPVTLLFALLALAAAFGLLGALLATPLTAFIRAYYDEFYLAGKPRDPDLDDHVDAMLSRELDSEGQGEAEAPATRERAAAD